jgi:hypothetical protein
MRVILQGSAWLLRGMPAAQKVFHPAVHPSRNPLRKEG